jgi:mRNA-degrading endonuclease RelE of RelBE toxin-antitoxin system
MAWLLKAHPLIEKDIKRLSKTEKEHLSQLILRIKENPNRFKPLTGYAGCFRIRFSGLRLVYAIKRETIWLIIVDKRKKVYKEMAKRIKGL